MTTRQIVLLLTAAAFLFEGDLLVQQWRTSSAIRRVFAVSVLPLLATSALVLYRRWHGG
jgi:hypothetical protein